MAEPATFEVQGLRFGYGSRDDSRTPPVIRDLALRLAPGRFHAVVGPNGCGKTTLLDLLCGALRPLAGRVRFQGRDVAVYRRRELARRLAMAPQEFSVAFPFSVREVVAMGRHPHVPRFAGLTAQDLDAVDQALTLFGLEDLAEADVTGLSSGEKQRVVLARVLAQDAPVMLLDEPTSHLDPGHALDALHHFAQAVRAQGRTVVAVLHDLNLAAAHCDELVLMDRGQVLDAGPRDAILKPETLERLFGVRARVRHDAFTGAPSVTLKRLEAS